MIDDVNPGLLYRPALQERCSCGNPACAQTLDPDGVDSIFGMAVVVDPRLPPGVAALVAPDGDVYPMSIGEPTLDNCRACKGTGEINEFPADDDERLVACPTCGGTGEVYE